MKSYFIALVIVLGLLTGCSAPAPQTSSETAPQQPAEQANTAPTPAPQQQSPEDAKVPGTEFNATGIIPCSMGGGAPTGNCDMGVVREGNGSGMVTVTKPDGSKRVIFFQNGKATGFDQSQADKGIKFSATRQNDLNIVTIGQERYEIPDAVIFGG